MKIDWVNADILQMDKDHLSLFVSELRELVLDHREVSRLNKGPIKRMSRPMSMLAAMEKL